MVEPSSRAFGQVIGADLFGIAIGALTVGPLSDRKGQDGDPAHAGTVCCRDLRLCLVPLDPGDDGVALVAAGFVLALLLVCVERGLGSFLELEVCVFFAGFLVSGALSP